MREKCFDNVILIIVGEGKSFEWLMDSLKAKTSLCAAMRDGGRYYESM